MCLTRFASPCWLRILPKEFLPPQKINLSLFLGDSEGLFLKIFFEKKVESFFVNFGRINNLKTDLLFAIGLEKKKIYLTEIE